jgi:septin family protein
MTDRGHSTRRGGYDFPEEEEQAETPKVPEMLFVLIGPTRSGKSTLINTVLGRPVAQEGKQMDAYSCTQNIANYRNLEMSVEQQSELNHTTRMSIQEQPLILNFIDTIGLGDVKVTHTDEEI